MSRTSLPGDLTADPPTEGCEGGLMGNHAVAVRNASVAWMAIRRDANVEYTSFFTHHAELCRSVPGRQASEGP